MLSVAEALARVLADVPVLGTEVAPLSDALERVLAGPVISRREIPPWDNSSMDGYAVRAADTSAAGAEHPVVLQVVGEIAAGGTAPRAIRPSEAYRILTGAPLPPGSDAVVPQEDVQRNGARVSLDRPVEVGAYVRQRGEDIRSGDRMLEAGTVLRPAALGVLASLGHARVDVYRRPTLAVLSTGDELVEPDSPLGPGQIPDSNSYTLCGLARAAGAVPLSLGIAPDSREALVERLRRGLHADVIVSSAGVSVGDRNFIREAAESLGARLDFWKVNMRPGKPITFGRIGDRFFFGLPGNPVSSMVTFELFVRPVLRRLGGYRTLNRPRIHARALEPIDNPGSRPGYLRVRLERSGGEVGARPTGNQGSGILRSMLLADGLAVIPGDTQIPKGSEVDVILLTTEFGLAQEEWTA